MEFLRMERFWLLRQCEGKGKLLVGFKDFYWEVEVIFIYILF